MQNERSLKHVTQALREGAELRNMLAIHFGRHIVDVAILLADCFRSGGKLLFFGNGGSAADAQHLAAEFVGRFVRERRALPALALTTDTSIIAAIGNDYGFDQVFARQVQALACPNDIAIGISTSGNSPNVVAALREARRRGLKTVGMAGKDGGVLKDCVDFGFVIPSTNTARIQECHITIGHLWCELVDDFLFGDS